MTFEGDKAPPSPQVYDLVLVAVGPQPNGKQIGAEKAGVAVNERGFIPVDRQMRTNVPHIFAIGDIAAQPMLAHKAMHEGHVAAEAAAGQKSSFDARVIPSVAYTDPEIAWVGLTEERGEGAGHQVRQGGVSLGGVGPRDRQRPRRRLHEAALRRQRRTASSAAASSARTPAISSARLRSRSRWAATPVDIGKTIHPHPTLSESVGMAAEVFEGVCTDLPPPRKR